MKGTILLVDDEKTIVELAQTVLARAGYRMLRAESADDAMTFLRKESVDLMLLDIQLPGISGLELLKLIRHEARTASLPVIMLTVLGEIGHKVRGLEAGADDYLVKPFAGKELLARIDAILRRTRRAEQPSSVLEAAGVSVDLDRREAAVRGKRVKLAPVEFDLLALILRRKGFVLTYEALSDSLSQGSRVMTSESLYAHVKNLRQSLGAAGKQIETVHGVGYKFVES